MMASSSRQPAKKSKEDESTTSAPNWVELPRDVTANILQRLDPFEILRSARSVCSLWRNICNDPFMWRTIDLTDHDILNRTFLVNFCRHVVELSCGQVEDINIEYFATDDLLKYIADSASHLRRLRLAICRAITNKGLSDVAEKFTVLEELDISFCYLSTDSLEAIGRCCPLLKSLKFSQNFSEEYDCDENALAIGRTMPGLCRLKIFGNVLTNVGLLAILDGCPLLESLDLRECYHLDLSGSLGKRCRDQIKDLLLPDDSIGYCYEDHDSYFDRSYGYSYWDYLDNPECADLIYQGSDGNFYLDYDVFY